MLDGVDVMLDGVDVMLDGVDVAGVDAVVLTSGVVGLGVISVG